MLWCCFINEGPVSSVLQWHTACGHQLGFAVGEDGCPPRVCVCVCVPVPATITVSPANWLHVTKSEWRKRIHHFLSCSFLENGWVRGPGKRRGFWTERKLSEIKGDLSQPVSWRPSLSFMPQPHLSSFSDTEKYNQSAIRVYNNEDMTPPSMFILTAWRRLCLKEQKHNMILFSVSLTVDVNT